MTPPDTIAHPIIAFASANTIAGSYQQKMFDVNSYFCKQPVQSVSQSVCTFDVAVSSKNMNSFT